MSRRASPSRPGWRASWSARASHWTPCAPPARAGPRHGCERRSTGAAIPAARDRSPHGHGGAVAAATAAGVAAAIVLPGALSADPTVGDASALSREPPTQGAPGGDPNVPQRLDAEVDGVAFPDYAAKFGWQHAALARTSWTTAKRPPSTTTRAAGRSPTRSWRATRSTHRQARARPAAAASTTAPSEIDDRVVVTWERGGHTCVLSAESVDAEELIALAGLARPGRGQLLGGRVVT